MREIEIEGTRAVKGITGVKQATIMVAIQVNNVARDVEELFREAPAAAS
jgi:hypothetical protein